jgi:chemosensory pili system protein ChpA (sensor histidine kinase/response regulator)
MDPAHLREVAQMARQHIFVANSSAFILELLRELLQGERYNVTTTNYVPNTFDQIQALAPDLLVIDLTLGEWAGWELLEQLQADALTRGVPVIVFSTEPALLDRARALPTPGGTRRFLEKPFHLTALMALVEELIGPA